MANHAAQVALAGQQPKKLHSDPLTLNGVGCYARH